MAVDQLTPSRAAALGGPDWLVEQRRAAADRFASTPLPDASAEEWRYSRVDDLDLGRYEPVGVGTVEVVTVPDEAQAVLAALGPSSGHAVLVDGVLADVRLADDLAGRGVQVGRLAELAVLPTDGIAADHLGLAPDPFGDLTVAHGADPLVVVVPRGVTVPQPVHVVHVVTVAGALVLPRLVVFAGDDSQVELVEWSTSWAGAVGSLVLPRTEVLAGPAARVGMVTVNAWGAGVDQIASTTVDVGQEASLRLTHVALGGGSARARFDCRLSGRGATGRLAALYLGDGEQQHDLRTFQSHDARDTTSDLLFKGALDDHARAIYTGLIRVDHEGRGANANQTNRVIKLSDDAWAESVPNLEIHHNDVRCSHATAVGPIDEDQRFYLESRGVPPESAERLVVNGFFEEVLDTIAVPEVVAAVRPLIGERLGGRR